MTANTNVHTCSYYCERPECIKRQRDELRDWMESVGDRMESELAQQPAGVDEAMVARFLSAFRNTPGDEAIGADEKVARRWLIAAMAQPAGGGCHCGTCTCNPNMTPAVRFDLSPAQLEGAIRDHLIRLGWTPPNTAPPPSAPVVAAESAEPAVWVAADTLNSPHPVCVSSLAYMSQLDRERGREYVPLYTATQQPAGVMPDGISDDVIKAVWRAAMTSAHNVCVNRSNRWNDDDGPDDRITEANECAKEIAHWLEADEGFIAEIRAALAAQQQGGAE